VGATLLGAVGWAWPAAHDPCTQPVEPVAETVLEEDGLLWVERTATDRDAPVTLVVRRPGQPCLLITENTATVGLVGPGPVQVEVHSLDGGQPSLAVQLAHTPLTALTDDGMRPELALDAARAVDSAWTTGLPRRPVLVVVDFGMASDEDRLWMVKLDEARVARRWMVSHGKMSGGFDKLDAVRFSNRPYSNQSSLGLYVGAETYVGKHGRSLRLDGLEPAFNDRARDRAIVVHGAAYARPEHVAEWGYLGRSFGCPAIDDREAQQLIDALAEGSLLFVGHPAVDWRGASELWWGE
jgi:hypothetical protein